MWNRCAIVQSKYRAKTGAEESQLSHSFSEKKKMFGGEVSAGAFYRWPQAAKVVDFSEWFCLSEIARTTRMAGCQRDLGRRGLDCAPCQMVRIVTRFARTR